MPNRPVSLRNAFFQPPLLLACVALLFAGCGPKNQSYTVSITNDSSKPVTIGLVKEGGREQAGWLSPEQVAMGPKDAAGNRRWDNVVVPPGRTADAGPVSGKFGKYDRAMLRVYAGELERLPQVVAISRGDPRRLDLTLSPGANAFRVIDRDGRLAAEPMDPAALAPADGK